MRKGFLITNIVLTALCVVLDVVYLTQGSLLLKGITSAVFALLGIVNLVYAIMTKSNNLKFAIIMVIGLVFAMTGDIVLEIVFIAGAALFGIGHVFYFIAYSALQKFSVKDFIPALCIFVPCFILLMLPIFDFGGIVMHIVCIAYAAVISCMVGKSISNYINTKTLLSLIILVGSALFCFSDLALVFSCFSSALPKVLTIVLCLATYYPAECILAYSIFKSTDK